jgi:PAS domain S-box-containing protein
MSKQLSSLPGWQALDISPDAIVLVNDDGEIIYFNHQAEHLFGYSSAEVLDKKIEILIPNEYREEHVSHRAKFMDNPRSYCIDKMREVTGLCKDGLELPVDIKLGPVEMDGRVLVCVSIRDASLRLQRDEAIRASDARFKQLIETMNEGFAEADENYIFKYVNSKLCDMLGYSRNEIVGKPLLDFIHDDDKELMQEQMNLRRQGIAKPFELSFADKNGQRVYTLASPKAVFDEYNTFKGSFGVLTNLTGLKQDERALKASEERYRTLVETISYGVQESDLDGKIIFSNKAHSKMHVYEEGELLGKLVWDMAINDEQRDYLRQYYFSVIEDHPPPTPFYTQDKTKAGEIIDVQVDWNYRYDEMGNQTGFVSIITDITQRKQVEQELKQYQNHLEAMVAGRTAELEDVNKELESFSYSVSHDLYAPLRYINGFSQALLEDYANHIDDVGKDYLQRIHNSAQDMKRQIDALLTLSKVTRGVINRKVVDLSAIAYTVVSKYQDYDAQRKVDINIEPGITGWGDARLLEILLDNLIGNAWKYTNNTDNAHIDFGVIEKDGKTIYHVRDNGVGFDMKHADRLFGAFQRLHKDSEFEGAGIGLATVARIIRCHGGQVWADAKIDKGATFYFTLGAEKITNGARVMDFEQYQ